MSNPECCRSIERLNQKVKSYSIKTLREISKDPIIHIDVRLVAMNELLDRILDSEIVLKTK